MASRDSSLTVLAQPRARLRAVAGAVCIGALVLAPLVTEKYIQVPPVALAERIPRAAVAAWLAIGAVIVVPGCFRALAMGVRISPDGVLVRNYFRTYKLSWPQVSKFRDGTTPSGDWALNVITRSGLAVTATGTAIANYAPADMLTAIRQAASRYGIPAHVHGFPLEWRGPKAWVARGLLVIWVIVILFMLLFFFLAATDPRFCTGCTGSGG